MNDNLLQEYNEFSYTLEELNESGRPKSFKLKGIFQKSDTPNGNKRMYPKAVLEGAVNSVMNTVTEGRMLGELDHPDDAKIHLDKVSHKITKLTMSADGTVIGEAEVLPTPSGKILESLLASGVKLGISSRGFGSTKEANGLQEVQSDFKLVTFDIVSDPSTPGAFPSAVYEHNEHKSESQSSADPSVTTLGYALEDILGTDVKIISEKKEYVCSDDKKNRFYTVEGEKDSYGTLNFHISHDYHVLVKNDNLEERIAINSENIKLFEDVYGSKVANRVLNKVEELGYNSKTFFAIKKEDL